MATTAAPKPSQATDIPALLRFLTKSASVSLSDAMRLIPTLQRASLTTTSSIAAKPVAEIRSLLFPDDEKAAKQLHNAAKRASGGGKRKKDDEEQGAEGFAGARKRRRSGLDPGHMEPSQFEMEAELALPCAQAVEEHIVRSTVLFTNRAPLLLAFAVTLLKYTMPEQPLSSRLSLAQAMVSSGARARAITLGLEKAGAEEEGWGKGQPVVKVMGKDVTVLRRWGYEFEDTSIIPGPSKSDLTLNVDDGAKVDINEKKNIGCVAKSPCSEMPPEQALWGLDLEALKKSNGPPVVSTSSNANTTGLPIYTPQSARSYLMKSFATASSEASKPGTKKLVQEKVQNLGLLLATLDILYQSWSSTIDKSDLDRRAWTWYVSVRPEVEDGVRGWGGKGEVKLEKILELRRTTGS